MDASNKNILGRESFDCNQPRKAINPRDIGQIGGFVRRLVLAVSLALLAACGGDGSQSTAPAQSSAPTPTPTPTPLSSAEKLKASLVNGMVRTVQPVDVDFSVADASTISNPVVIAPGDPRIRLLGGLHVVGTTYPYTLLLTPYAIDPELPQSDPNFVSLIHYGLNTGFEFNLPAGQRMFEWVTLDNGAGGPAEIAINGVLTNDIGYTFAQKGDGSFKYIDINLPASNVARLVTVYTPRDSFGGLNLPSGSTLDALSADAINYASVVFEGDSITEGSVATTQTKTWIMQASFQLGIRNPINVAIGGSGYLAHRTGEATIPQRINDVITAVNGSPPDAVVVAAGINDCGAAPPAGFAPADIQAAALGYFNALRAASPKMAIIVLGPFTSPTDPTYAGSAILACRDAIFAAAAQVPLTYTVDVSDWVTAANVSTVFDGNVNGPHPVDAGHAIYGTRAAEALKTIFQAL